SHPPAHRPPHSPPTRRSSDLLATACATGRPQSEATPVTAGGGTPSARLHALADEMWDTTLAVSPTIGTFLGLPGARHDRMDDNSLETVRRLQDRRDAWWARLQGLPTETFNGTNDAVLLAIVRETLATSRQRRICRGERSEEHTSELQSLRH